MATYKLTGKYETLIDRLSKDLSVELGRHVSKTEAIQAVLDVVIEEEKLFSTKEQPSSFFRRTIFRIKSKSVPSKTIYEILDTIHSLVSFKP